MSAGQSSSFGTVRILYGAGCQFRSHILAEVRNKAWQQRNIKVGASQVTLRQPSAAMLSYLRIFRRYQLYVEISEISGSEGRYGLLQILGPALYCRHLSSCSSLWIRTDAKICKRQQSVKVDFPVARLPRSTPRTADTSLALTTAVRGLSMH